MSLIVSPEDKADALPRMLRTVAGNPAELPGAPGERVGVVVTGLEIPFGRLVWALLRLAVAALPALALLGLVVYGLGEGLALLFPELVQLKILTFVPPV